MVWLLVGVLSIVAAIYLFAYIINKQYHLWHLSYSAFFQLLFQVSVIALIPISVYTILHQNYLLRKNLVKALTMTKELRSGDLYSGTMGTQSEPCILRSENGKERLLFHLDQALFLLAAGNYVEIVSYTDRTTRELLRNTLSNLEIQLSQYQHFFRCHRSYIVNLTKITKVSGNAQGLKLTLKHFDETIPVARNYVEKFRAKISSS
jgi:DNA-binding LytR/AlgR family response regulator